MTKTLTISFFAVSFLLGVGSMFMAVKTGLPMIPEPTRADREEPTPQKADVPVAAAAASSHSAYPNIESAVARAQTKGSMYTKQRQTAAPSVAQNEDAAHDPGPAPVYGWGRSREESFVIGPGQQRLFPVAGSYADDPLKPHYIRWEMKATEPIDAGALDNSFVRDDDQNASYFFGSPVTLCYKPRSLKSEHTCRLPGTSAQGWIVLKDSRQNSPEANIGAVAGAVLGIRQPLQERYKQNRVTVTIYEWTCQQFCP